MGSVRVTFCRLHTSQVALKGFDFRLSRLHVDMLVSWNEKKNKKLNLETLVTIGQLRLNVS